MIIAVGIVSGVCAAAAYFAGMWTGYNLSIKEHGKRKWWR